MTNMKPKRPEPKRAAAPRGRRPVRLEPNPRPPPRAPRAETGRPEARAMESSKELNRQREAPANAATRREPARSPQDQPSAAVMEEIRELETELDRLIDENSRRDLSELASPEDEV